jgi:hypothetical protein
MTSMDAFLACPATQLLAYQTYISERSPFWTQQGIKGAEFDRVLVVLDDAESTHFQFSYENTWVSKRFRIPTENTSRPAKKRLWIEHAVFSM